MDIWKQKKKIMRLIVTLSLLANSLMLCSCMHKDSNPIDPYASMNRETHKFNTAFDATMLKPPARLYRAVLPQSVRSSINNAYNNIFMLPSIASDLLQGDFRYAVKDTWRFLINSTLGIGGLFDVADRSFSLPPHFNDMGLTFAKWGVKKSPYIVLPFIGPSTVRDALGLPLDYALTPYPYLGNGVGIYAISTVRYVDVRAQLLEVEPILNQAIDKYTFLRDAYLQRRNFLITGEQPDNDASIYIDEKEVIDYIDEESEKNKKVAIAKHSSAKPDISSKKDAAHSLVSARNSAQHR